ncbi:MAG TPA: hypothetical protein VGI81_12675 [Tepidisphaeraceae bacterium]
MSRRTFTVLSAASLVGCVAIVVLWQRSYRGCDVLIGQHGPGGHVTCTSEFGQVVFEVEGRQRGQVEPGWSYFQKSLPRRFRRHQEDVAGFAAWRGTVRHYVLLLPSPLWGVAVPHWFLFLCTAALPATTGVRWSARRVARARVRRGLCARCGYDLRASAGRCPECGLERAGAG